MELNKITISLALAMGFVANAAVADDEQVNENIEKIVVTGQKIDRSLKETPNSVSVLTAQEMNKLNVQNMADVYNMVPNLSGDFNQGFTIRGITYDNVSGGGNSYLTSVYLDGAPLPFRVVRSGTTSVWDLSQVEVFRGPQSTLQGRNALAGAIMMRTQDPTYEYSAKAKVGFGEHGQREYAFAGGGAIVEDMLAFRVAVEDTAYDGDIDNITRNEGSNYADSQTLRAKLLFEPTDNVDALLTASRAKSEFGPQWVLFDYGQDPFQRTVWNNSHIFEKNDTDIYNLEISWDINDEWTFDSITTYSDSEYRYNWDGDMTPVQVVADSQYVRNDKTLSQELRFTYQTSDIQLVSGAYFSKLDVDDKAAGERFLSFADLGLPPLEVLLTAPAELGGFGLPAEYAAMIVPMYPDIDPVMLGLDSSMEQKVETMALFADLKWKLTDQFDLLAGLRYDREDQQNASYANYSILNNMPDPASVPAPLDQIVAGINGTLNGMAASASGVEPQASADFSAWLPKLGLSYHFSDDVTTSFIYQRGYRSGGVGTNIAQQQVFTYDPEYTDNFELSYRSVWQGGDLMLNANLFYTKWQDQQIAIQLSQASFDTQTVNAGESNIKGFETELFYYPTKQLSIIAGVGLAKTEFDKFDYVVQRTGEVKDLAGRSFADSPEWTANIAANYDFDNGIKVGVNANYKGESYAYLDPETSLDADKYAIDSDPKNDARVLVNANASYTWDDTYTIRADVKNLFDVEYISNYFSEADDLGKGTSYGQHQIGRSRQFSVTLSAAF
ncbi:TonB-dependent receptor [Shewanella sp. WXL01]|uniref:TonB-dependent receptor n=1 Tax=Shewanella sp. WXL01 TaxID=2709721 RepID=UPI00143857D9|nr:TonB-dependent receptor [Shewanella sp. WXL01]NKF52289.1 TonB-dependent receptor [Shewanella sp. WXL01]